MSVREQSATWGVRGDLPEDISKAITGLEQRINSSHSALSQVFDSRKPLFAARAPGRLDVMGGIADYSGSMVLQWPLRQSAVALVQKTKSRKLDIFTIFKEDNNKLASISFDIDRFLTSEDGNRLSNSQIAEQFRTLPDQDRWSAYVAGALVILGEEFNIEVRHGIAIYLDSDVPVGKGVSSSAAIEVATMRAMAALLHIDLDAHRLAKLCQRVENTIVGAPCGLMDQMTSSAGSAGSLLTMLCQPDLLMKPTKLPSGLSVWGIDSGVSHSVAGNAYTAVRVAAFMGYRMMMRDAGVAGDSVPAADVVDNRWNGYLANITASEFDQYWSMALPESSSGKEFLQHFDATTDAQTNVNADVRYAIRHCTAHPVYEHHRARVFSALAEAAQHTGTSQSVKELMGECMYQSHAGYSRCGLGSRATDAIVAACRAAGPDRGIYGARVSGGGCGGTVVVLADSQAESVVHAIAQQYAKETGEGGEIFSGTSDGAREYLISPRQ